jgi:hypothetical protein
MSAWVATHGRKPRTGDKALWIKFRNGQESRHTYVAAQLVWVDRGWDFDCVAVRRA